MEKKKLNKLRKQHDLIKEANEKCREKSKKLVADKSALVRQLKDEAIKQEIIKIGEKDNEARRLEKYERRILKRLRETHLKQ